MGKELPMGSVGRDTDRAEEEYDNEEASMRKQLHESNVFNLFFRHEPSRPWHKQNSRELWKGNSGQHWQVADHHLMQ